MSRDRCENCRGEIRVQILRGTGICSERCHKALLAKAAADDTGEAWDSGRLGWGTVNLVTDIRMPTGVALLVHPPAVCATCGFEDDLEAGGCACGQPAPITEPKSAAQIAQVHYDATRRGRALLNLEGANR